MWVRFDKVRLAFPSQNEILNSFSKDFIEEAVGISISFEKKTIPELIVECNKNQYMLRSCTFLDPIGLNNECLIFVSSNAIPCRYL